MRISGNSDKIGSNKLVLDIDCSDRDLLFDLESN